MRLETLPAPVRRVLAFSLVGIAVYAVLVGAGMLFYPGSAGTTGYRLSATLAAGAAAFYLVYLGGIGKVGDLLG